MSPTKRLDRTLPLSRERLRAALTAQGYRVEEDAEGDLTGLWGKDRFWFLILGEALLQVRGRWHRTFAPSRRQTALLLVNDWNRDRIWPKAYLRSEGARMAVYAEMSVDLGAGVTDEQLATHLTCGLGTAGRLFSALDAQMQRLDPSL